MWSWKKARKLDECTNPHRFFCVTELQSHQSLCCYFFYQPQENKEKSLLPGETQWLRAIITTKLTAFSSFETLTGTPGRRQMVLLWKTPSGSCVYLHVEISNPTAASRSSWSMESLCVCGEVCVIACVCVRLRSRGVAVDEEELLRSATGMITELFDHKERSCFHPVRPSCVCGSVYPWKWLKSTPEWLPAGDKEGEWWARLRCVMGNNNLELRMSFRSTQCSNAINLTWIL